MYWEDEKKSCSEGNIIGNGGVTKRPMAEDGQTDKCDDEVSPEGGCSNGGVTKRPRAEEGQTEDVLPEGGSTMPRRGRGRPLGSKKRRRGRPQGSKKQAQKCSSPWTRRSASRCRRRGGGQPGFKTAGHVQREQPPFNSEYCHVEEE